MLPAAPGQRGTAAPWRAACRDGHTDGPAAAGRNGVLRAGQPGGGATPAGPDTRTRWLSAAGPAPAGRAAVALPGRLQGRTRLLSGPAGRAQAGGREAPAARDAHNGGPGADSAVRPQAPAALPPPRRHRAPGAGCDWLGTGRRPDSLANERSPRRRRANGQLRFSLRARGRLSLLKARRGRGEGSEVRAAPPEVEAGAAVPPILSQPAACTSVLFPRGPVFLGPPRAVLPW